MPYHINLKWYKLQSTQTSYESENLKIFKTAQHTKLYTTYAA